jgi:hypothetical protein
MYLAALFFVVCWSALVSGQCNDGSLNVVSYPSHPCSQQIPAVEQTVYIPPDAICTFAETVVESGNCASYVDVATLIGPIGAAVTNTYSGTATLPNGVTKTLGYNGAAPAGLLAQGLYNLVVPLNCRTNFLGQFNYIFRRC